MKNTKTEFDAGLTGDKRGWGFLFIPTLAATSEVINNSSVRETCVGFVWLCFYANIKFETKLSTK